MRRILAVVTAGALVLGGLTGCPTEPSSSGAKGTVVERDSYRRMKCSIRSCHTYKVTVRENGGRKDKGSVSKAVYESCQVGDAWPACKKEAKK